MAAIKPITSIAKLQELLDRDHTLNSGVLFGIEGCPIEVQARAIRVLKNPAPWRAVTEISGMASGAISEALSRIEGAFAKYRIPDPQVRILINLAPADLLKEGTSLDLPLAIIMLQASGYLPDLPEYAEGEYVLIGELGIHGEVRRVPGALSLAFRAVPGQKLIVPSGNERECLLILAKPGHENCAVLPVSNLEEVIEFFQSKRKLESAFKGEIKFEHAVQKAVDFGKVKGQRDAKRAAVICAAGGHNLLLIGPPGEGKSLLASAIPGILPRLSDEEKVVLTKIYSACGALEADGMAVSRRPFRSVHHGASRQSLIGGGSGVARPGEITLSHLGILFLDEIAEFNRGTLDSLRQPMESGEVQISRVKATMSYPCRFTLVAAMNPCPCGFYGTTDCTCVPARVKAYQQKLSGPIVDRIDLQVELERLTLDDRFAPAPTEPQSPRLRQRVEEARDRQRSRFKGTGISCNAAIPGGHVAEYCDFSSDGFDNFKTIIDESSLSTRSMDRLAKVARTVADLSLNEKIEPQHLDEAKRYVVGGMLRDSKL